MPKNFYHYTKESTARKIEATGELKHSSNGLGGPGLYAASIPPSASDKRIIENNYDGASSGRERYVEAVVKIPITRQPEKNIVYYPVHDHGSVYRIDYPVHDHRSVYRIVKYRK